MEDTDRQIIEAQKAMIKELQGIIRNLPTWELVRELEKKIERLRLINKKRQKWKICKNSYKEHSKGKLQGTGGRKNYDRETRRIFIGIRNKRKVRY